MTASCKNINSIRPLLKGEDERYLIHTWLLILILEIIFLGGFLLTTSRSQIHMLLVQLAPMSDHRGRIIEEFWKLKDCRAGNDVPCTTKYIDTNENINSVGREDDVTSMKSYGRKLNNVKEGRWMFWYPGWTARVIKHRVRSNTYSPDAFEDYRGMIGQPAAIGCFEDGHRKGWWKFYNMDGSLDIVKTGFYDNDTLIKRGKNPLFIPGVVLVISALLVFNILPARMMVWLDATFKKADTKFGHC